MHYITKRTGIVLSLLLLFSVLVTPNVAQASSAKVLNAQANDALAQFRNSDGWEVGVDGSVALIKMGAGGSLDTTNVKAPVLGVVFGNKGLMYNLTLEGTKMSRIKK